MGVSTARPKRGRGGRGRGIYPTWASGVYLTGGGVYLTGSGVYLTKVVSCYPFPIYNIIRPIAHVLCSLCLDTNHNSDLSCGPMFDIVLDVTEYFS